MARDDITTFIVVGELRGAELQRNNTARRPTRQASSLLIDSSLHSRLPASRWQAI